MLLLFEFTFTKAVEDRKEERSSIVFPLGKKNSTQVLKETLLTTFTSYLKILWDNFDASLMNMVEYWDYGYVLL